MWFNRSAHHFVFKTSGSTESLTEVATFTLNVQPASAQTTALINGEYGKTYTAYTTYSGLNTGDAVTLSGTTTISGGYFNVRGVKELNYGALAHFEVVITKPEI